MKKIPNFEDMEYMTSTINLMNYELQGSNSNNYGASPQTSSPVSFPVLMDNGILVKYESVKFATEIIEEDKPKENNLKSQERI